MSTVRLLLLFLLLVSSAVASDLVLTDGTVLKTIRLREKTDLGLRLQHDGGLSFIDYARIPEPAATVWGYEEAKYRQAQQSALKPSDAAPDAASAPANAVADSPRSRPYRTQCQGMTKKGRQCSRTAGAGQSTCYQHR